MQKNLNVLDPSKQFHEVGVLHKKVIDLLGLDLAEERIVMGKDRIEHIEKHRSKFANDQDFIKHVEALPEIIENPDYVGKHPTGKSIEYIKKIDEIMIVAVRVKTKGKLWVKTAFPITEDKLNIYLQSGTLKEYK